MRNAVLHEHCRGPRNAGESSGEQVTFPFAIEQPDSSYELHLFSFFKYICMVIYSFDKLPGICSFCYITVQVMHSQKQS